MSARSESVKPCKSMCEVKGCDMTSGIKFYGHDFCWQHYCSYIEAWRVDAFSAQQSLFPLTVKSEAPEQSEGV